MGEQITVMAAKLETYEKLRDLIKRTNTEKPKADDLAALRRLFDEEPDLWHSIGNMAKRTLEHLCRTYYHQSAYLQECVDRQLEEMRTQFGYGESSPLEKILIEQILVCYVNLYVLEINSATKLCESHSTEAGLYWDRRLTGAQRRFRRACESLARVKKLLRNSPTLQFNVSTSGGQQLNIAGR